MTNKNKNLKNVIKTLANLGHKPMVFHYPNYHPILTYEKKHNVPNEEKEISRLLENPGYKPMIFHYPKYEPDCNELDPYRE